jgi:hypothetical protein
MQDMVGKRYGMWTVLSITDGRYMLLCRCDCGKEKPVYKYDLQLGKSTNCGCRRLQQMQAALGGHGLSCTPAYAVWCNMVSRCENPNSGGYHNYGGRGITICSGLRDPATFVSEVGQPEDGMTLDRIDNDLGYWCGRCSECRRKQRDRNVRWATRKQQMNNVRKNHIIRWDGKDFTLSQLAELAELHPMVLYSRLRNGWDLCTALITRVRPRRRS